INGTGTHTLWHQNNSTFFLLGDASSAPLPLVLSKSEKNDTRRSAAGFSDAHLPRWTETRQTATPRHQRPTKSVASADVVALAFRFSTHLGCFRRRFAPMFGIVGHVQFRSLPTTL